MALMLTQPLTEMSIRNNSWGVKAAGAYIRKQDNYSKALYIVLCKTSIGTLYQTNLVVYVVSGCIL
jgi:hypothetical protein